MRTAAAAWLLGAMTYLEKSTDRESLERAFTTIEQSARPRMKKLLLVTADEIRRASIRQFLGSGDLEILDAATAEEAIGDSEAANRSMPSSSICASRYPGHSTGGGNTRCGGSVTFPVVLYGKRKLAAKEEVGVQRLQRSMVLKLAQSREIVAGSDRAAASPRGSGSLG